MSSTDMSHVVNLYKMSLIFILKSVVEGDLRIAHEFNRKAQQLPISLFGKHCYMTAWMQSDIYWSSGFVLLFFSHRTTHDVLQYLYSEVVIVITPSACETGNPHKQGHVGSFFHFFYKARTQFNLTSNTILTTNTKLNPYLTTIKQLLNESNIHLTFI
jgi:hypothetical protein